MPGDLSSEIIEISHSGPSLGPDEIVELLPLLDSAWSAEDDKLRRSYSFADFDSALAFVNRVGELAEASDHHPLITFTWGRVDLEIWTHSIGGLQRGDFVWAAHADALAS
jgi:4a-hydroxytetrahydrobiopterin dehydratase